MVLALTSSLDSKKDLRCIALTGFFNVSSRISSCMMNVSRNAASFSCRSSSSNFDRYFGYFR